MAIPLVDLKAQYENIKDEVSKAIARVVDNSAFILGEEVALFEQEFARFCGTRYAIGVSSGTAALHLALLACGVGPGDEVITVPHTFIATAEAISHCGARPVFVDIDSATYNIDVNRIEEKLTSRTKAILPVHLYGQPADMEPILDLAAKYGLKVVEDAAQAHGAEYKGKRVGSFGDAACFSFYPAKNLGAWGDGGMVTTNSEEVTKKVLLLRNHGRETKYEHVILGYCHRLDALQAAILRVKLKRLDEWNELRRTRAKLYNELFEDAEVAIPYEPLFARSVYHLYVIRVIGRDRLQQWLKARGIETGIHYPLPLHLQPAYRYLGHRRGDFPVAERCAQENLSLPIFPELGDEQVHTIVAEVKAFLSSERGA